ncbi:transmembrane protein 65, partial [Cyclospora cayetanensis]|uniref:Transmembrane protein 65 n=1 Tax=Cyclospora cayetanensis TaxID=88456 RepID=A0A6P6RTG6_9EIME
SSNGTSSSSTLGSTARRSPLSPASDSSSEDGGSSHKSSTSKSSSSDVDSSLVDSWFAAIDANRDGLISQREFRTWYCLHFVPTFLQQQQQQIQRKLLDAKADAASSNASPAAAPAAQNDGAANDDAKTLGEDKKTGREACQLCNTSAFEGSQQHVQQRLLLLEAEAAALRAALQSGRPQQPISSKQMLLIVLRSAIPYIGFGFMDNCLMLLCGEIIDLQLGVALGLSTLAAAGLGNLVSCASGVVTGGFIERFVYRFKWPPTARLSPQQAETSAARNAHLVGSVVGF